LFLVLWLVSQGDQKLKASIANYFRTPGAFDTARGTILNGSEGSEVKLDTTMATKDDEKALYSTAALLRKKLSQIERDQIKIDITDEGLHIQILDKADHVSFGSGSADLAPATSEILKEIATTICDLPNQIDIGGHTDSYTFPTPGYTNWELSADRANAARRALEADCIKPDRIRRIVGYADTKPLDPGDPYSPSNRRISIMLLWQKSMATNKKAIDALTEDKPSKADAVTEDEPSKDKPSKAEPVTKDKASKDKPSKVSAVTEDKPSKVSEGKQKKPHPAGH